MMQFCGINLNIMKQILQIEELFQFLATILVLYFLPVHFPWWLWIILFLLSDLSMLGYLVNTTIGAFLYNIIHHKAIALIIITIGFFTGLLWLEVSGIILFGHIAMDRTLGFGFKYTDSFKHTHLDGRSENKADSYNNKMLRA